MKKTHGFTLGVVLFLVMLFPAIASASPFLVCDPFPAGSAVSSFVVFWDGSLTGVVAPVFTDATGTYLHLDLASVANGSHTVKVRARNSWGESADSLPFTFVKLVPSAPLNIRIDQN